MSDIINEIPLTDEQMPEAMPIEEELLRRIQRVRRFVVGDTPLMSDLEDYVKQCIARRDFPDRCADPDEDESLIDPFEG